MPHLTDPPPDRTITASDVAPAGYGTPLASELAHWVERFALSREEADALWSVATDAQAPRPSKVHQAWVVRKVGARNFDAAVIALLRGAYIRALNTPTVPRGFTSADTAPATPAANETTR